MKRTETSFAIYNSLGLFSLLISEFHFPLFCFLRIYVLYMCVHKWVQVPMHTYTWRPEDHSGVMPQTLPSHEATWLFYVGSGDEPQVFALVWQAHSQQSYFSSTCFFMFIMIICKMLNT